MRKLSILKTLNDSGSTTLSLVRDLDEQKFYIKKTLKVKIEFQRLIFENEIEIHSRLNHRYLIRFVERIDENSFLMEYASLGNLNEQVNHNWKEKMIWLIQIAQSLNYLHDIGYVHNDVKPSNILISGDGKAKLSDFEMTGKIGEINFKKSPDYFIQGTDKYMQGSKNSQQNNNPNNDIYSYGIVFYMSYLGIKNCIKPEPENIQDPGIRKIIKMCLAGGFKNSSELTDALEERKPKKEALWQR